MRGPTGLAVLSGMIDAETMITIDLHLRGFLFG